MIDVMINVREDFNIEGKNMETIQDNVSGEVFVNRINL
jgi:hypothetical protein